MTVGDLADELDRPLDSLTTLIRRYLHTQIYPDDELPAAAVDLDDLPFLSNYTKFKTFKCARTAYYSPSEEGSWGMHAELIRRNPSWYGDYERRDTMLVQTGNDEDVIGGLLFARVVHFIQIKPDNIEYPSAFLEWFLPVGGEPDPVTGMWIVEPEVDDVGRRIFDNIFRFCFYFVSFDWSYGGGLSTYGLPLLVLARYL